MTKTKPKPQPEAWQRRRQPKWRDVYCKNRVSPTWKRLRKHQHWRAERS